MKRFRRQKVANYWVPTDSYLLDNQKQVGFPLVDLTTNQVVSPLVGAPSDVSTGANALSNLSEKEFVVTRLVGRVYMEIFKSGDLTITGNVLGRVVIGVGIVPTDDSGAPSDQIVDSTAYDVVHTGRNAFFHRVATVFDLPLVLQYFTDAGVSHTPIVGSLSEVVAAAGWSPTSSSWGVIDIPVRRVIRADESLVLSVSCTVSGGTLSAAVFGVKYVHDLRVLGHMRLKKRR